MSIARIRPAAWNAPPDTVHGEDSVPLLDDAPGESQAQWAQQRWIVLVVDDDEDVHKSTELALRGMTIEGRPIELRHVYSAASARAELEQAEGIAVILLDVVMETSDAGLRLVRGIREELNRHDVRIILRTGQLGYAPEMDTIRCYDISDFKCKSELSQVRLYTSLTTAIRSYRQTVELTRARAEMALLAAQLLESRAAELAQADRRADAERALDDAHLKTDHEVSTRTRDLADRVDELESFNRMVAHDLRSPLHSLSALGNLIAQRLDHEQVPDARKMVQAMTAEVRRLARLVDRLLALASAGHGPLARQRAPLDDIVQSSLQSLALTTPRERLAGVRIGALPTVEGDSLLLAQVFVNLIGNALKFSRHEAEPRVDVDSVSTAAGWTIRVRDNGIGFDSQRASTLFTPFTRLHGSRYEGVGIGLAIVRRIVERHGGRVWAESSPGQGACFMLSLPHG
ncbi:MAG: hypothetical protein KIS83_13830 [Rubrivivax sp.]|nr:hypothetical protein [Rubrivivax sp.]